MAHIKIDDIFSGVVVGSVIVLILELSKDVFVQHQTKKNEQMEFENYFATKFDHLWFYKLIQNEYLLQDKLNDDVVDVIATKVIAVRRMKKCNTI